MTPNCGLCREAGSLDLHRPAARSRCPPALAPWGGLSDRNICVHTQASGLMPMTLEGQPLCLPSPAAAAAGTRERSPAPLSCWHLAPSSPAHGLGHSWHLHHLQWHLVLRCWGPVQLISTRAGVASATAQLSKPAPAAATPRLACEWCCLKPGFRANLPPRVHAGTGALFGGW